MDKTSKLKFLDPKDATIAMEVVAEEALVEVAEMIGAAVDDSAEVVSVEDAVTIVEEVDLEGAIADPADMAAEEEMIEDMIVAKAEVIAIAQENAIGDTVVGMTNFVKLVDTL